MSEKEYLDEVVEKCKVWALMTGNRNMFKMLDNQLSVEDYLVNVKENADKETKDLIMAIEAERKIVANKQKEWREKYPEDKSTPWTIEVDLNHLEKQLKENTRILDAVKEYRGYQAK